MQEDKLDRGRRSSEDDWCPPGEDERLVEVVSRVVLAHLVAWSHLNTGHTNLETSNLYPQMNRNASEMDPLAGLLSTHLSRGVELYNLSGQ